MNTEKIEKLKKGLNNAHISEAIKAKIKEQIAKLEAEDLSPSNISVKEAEIVVVEEEKPKEETPSNEVVEKKTRKPKAKKETVVEEVEKPIKRTVLVIAKEIRKENESWSSARERASKLINKSKDKAEVKAKKELEKLDKFIKTKKELDGISGKNLMRDAKRNAKQLGKRTVTHDGVTSNQYGTYKNKVGKTYYENRDGHGDRLSNSHKKGQPFLEKGGDLKVAKDIKFVRQNEVNDVFSYENNEGEIEYLYFPRTMEMTVEEIDKDLNFENGGDFMNNVYAEGGEVDNKHTYMMLGRLQMDCDYYLGHGNRSERHLWAGNVDEQIEEMKRLWNSLPKEGKPEWLSMEDILDYEKKMKSQSNEGNKHENGGDFMNNVYADGGDVDKTKLKEILKSAKGQAGKYGYDYYVYLDKEGDISFARKSEFERMFDKEECKLLLKVNEKGIVTKLENGGEFMNNVYEDGGMVDEEKRFEVDFYKKKSDDKPHSEKIYKSVKLNDLVDKITEKIKSSDDYEYAEFYHKNNGTEVYLGRIYKDNSYVFVQGNGYIAYIENFEMPKSIVNKDGVKVQSVYMPQSLKSEGEWMSHKLSSNVSRVYANGGTIDLDEIQIEVYKGFHGLKAETYIDNVNGFDWHIVTMKRYAGQLVSDAQSGKSIKKDGEVELFTFEYKSPNITLISTKPSRVTEKVIENQHREALAVFKERMEKESFENGGDFMNNVYEFGGTTNRTINLVPLQLVPLSPQLSRVTGDQLTSGIYVDENGNDYSTAEDAIIVHKESGQKFRLPARIYDRVDGYNLVINKKGDAVVVYETGLKVADIIDGKLDFSNKDESISIDRIKVKSDFEKGHIPSAKNADDEYKKIENELSRLYAFYEDEDDSEKAKELYGKRIDFLEDITHRLERKYESGGTIEGKKVIGTTASGKNVYDGVSEYSKIYKDFSSKDHLDASNLYMSTDLSDLNMSERDEYSAGHFRKTDEYKKDLAERKKRVQKKDLGGTFIVDGLPNPDLNGNTGMDYTGLVGETSAMSAGEMFAEGGVITVSKWDKWGFERDGDIGVSSRFKGLKNKKGDVSNGIVHFEGHGSAEFEYEDKTGNIYQSTEIPFELIDLTGTGYYGKDSFAKGGDVGNKRARRTKSQIEKDNYNKEVDAYKWYLIDVENKKALSGWEFKEDANDALSDYDGDKNFKVVAKSLLKTLEIPNPNETWKLEQGGSVNPEELSREEFLDTLMGLENNGWRSANVTSGGEIKYNKTLLRKYADGVEKAFKDAKIEKHSLNQSDYDYIANDNYHLLNDFLVWNNYYNPTVTKKEQAWRLAYSKDPKKSNDVSDPKTITVDKVDKKLTTNNARMQKATAYAKANRREGQSWKEAMKEAFEKTK